MIISYGSFNQLIKEIRGGRVLICLDKKLDLTSTTEKVLAYINSKHPDLVFPKKTKKGNGASGPI